MEYRLSDCSQIACPRRTELPALYATGIIPPASASGDEYQPAEMKIDADTPDDVVEAFALPVRTLRDRCDHGASGTEYHPGRIAAVLTRIVADDPADCIHIRSKPIACLHPPLPDSPCAVRRSFSSSTSVSAASACRSAGALHQHAHDGIRARAEVPVPVACAARSAMRSHSRRSARIWPSAGIQKVTVISMRRKDNRQRSHWIARKRFANQQINLVSLRPFT